MAYTSSFSKCASTVARYGSGMDVPFGSGMRVGNDVYLTPIGSNSDRLVCRTYGGLAALLGPDAANCIVATEVKDQQSEGQLWYWCIAANKGTVRLGIALRLREARMALTRQRQGALYPARAR